MTPAGLTQTEDSAAAQADLTQSAAIPPWPPLQGFRFSLAGGGSMGAKEALVGLAEGCMQCAVTGDAFGRLLQFGELSVVETIMRGAVVFSRMQPFHKGQVVDLLSTRGIHQLFDGQPRHIQVRCMTPVISFAVSLHFCGKSPCPETALPLLCPAPALPCPSFLQTVSRLASLCIQAKTFNACANTSHSHSQFHQHPKD